MYCAFVSHTHRGTNRRPVLKVVASVRLWSYGMVFNLQLVH